MTSVVVPTKTTNLQEEESLHNTEHGNKIPQYPHRNECRFIPRTEEDFADGGAYPEVHVLQYPANMGLKHKYKSGATLRTLVPTVDAKGEVDYSSVVRQGENKNKVVHASYESLREKHRDESLLQKPSEEEISQVTQKTQQALEKIVETKIAAAKPKNVEGVRDTRKPSFIRYTPASSDAAHNSGAKQRIIKVMEAPVDPLEPPRFQHKKTPAAPPSPPVPILHSPPRKLDPEEAENWKIPPCISNWKNNKGYTIPLDKRVAADGRGLQDVRINDKFAKFTESLYIAERNAREEVEKRAQIEKKLAEKKKEKREMELRELAARARNERSAQSQRTECFDRGTEQEENTVVEEKEDEDTESIPDSSLMRDQVDNKMIEENGKGNDYSLAIEEQKEYEKRERIRAERRRERQRQLRLWEKEEEMGRSGKRSKLARDQDRDVSERIALHQPIVNNMRGEVQYDQRLFNQSAGMDTGFGAEDSYNIYTKPLFSGGNSGSLFRPKKNMDVSLEDDKHAISSSERKFRPDIGFQTGEEQNKSAQVSSRQERTKPVEFEHDVLTSIHSSGRMVAEEYQEVDPLGLEEFLSEAKRADSKRKPEKDASKQISTQPNVMSFVGHSDASALQEEYHTRGGSHRSKIQFQRGKQE
eukprot:jgi/Galph1/1541/GphlegSOOS_G222.1